MRSPVVIGRVHPLTDLPRHRPAGKMGPITHSIADARNQFIGKLVAGNDHAPTNGEKKSPLVQCVDR